jgi:hypothetical protein
MPVAAPTVPVTPPPVPVNAPQVPVTSPVPVIAPQVPVNPPAIAGQNTSCLVHHRYKLTTYVMTKVIYTQKYKKWMIFC